MNTSRPSSCICAVSSIGSSRHVLTRFAYASQQQRIRHYATSKPGKKLQKPQDPSSRAEPPQVSTTSAIASKVAAVAALDRINPPATTLPPPLDVPTRGPNQGAAQYWFSVGRAYGRFYKDGIKAVWSNHKACRELSRRIQQQYANKDSRLDFVRIKYGFSAARRATYLRDAALGGSLNRAEYQLLERQVYDVGKLPFFGLLVLVFGEWLPLIVPFIPNAVPTTCRIPKQVRGMREKAQERRRWIFRMGIREPSRQQLEGADSARFKEEVERAAGRKKRDAGMPTWPLLQPAYVRLLVGKLNYRQLEHLSCTLNLHGQIWNKVPQVSPPESMFKRRIARRLSYLALDDALLVQAGGVQKLSPPEVEVACEERGIDVLGKPIEQLREMLAVWLRRQEKDGGRGSAVMTMLFRRPNAWTT